MPSAVEPPTKVVVLLSGGMDSAVAASIAAAQFGVENIMPITVHYGQKHDIETIMAINLAANRGWQRISELRIPPSLFVGSDSTLLQINPDKPNPEVSYEELQASVGPSPTYVPFRNGLMLSMATAYALSKGASLIYYGAHAEDARNWAYPDCTPEFNGAMSSAIFVGTYFKIRLCTPLQNMTKAQVVSAGLQLQVPFELTSSCYNARSETYGVACGKCPTCLSRIEAFKVNKVIDPIKYDRAAAIDWTGCQQHSRVTGTWQ